MRAIRNGVLVTAGCALLFLAWANAAEACACCADRGERAESVLDLKGYNREILDNVEFGSQANLYLTAAGAETIKGMRNPGEAYLFNVTVRKTRKSWLFSISDGKGSSGTLDFALPAHMREFSVDPKPEAGGDGSVELYKELTLDSRVTGRGMFAIKGKQAPLARLILHGAGNRCNAAGQFTNWTLDVSDNSAKYRFFGKLAPAP